MAAKKGQKQTAQKVRKRAEKCQKSRKQANKGEEVRKRLGPFCWSFFGHSPVDIAVAIFGSVKTGFIAKKKGFLVERFGGVILLLDLVGFLV